MATTLFNNLITFSRGSNATLTGPTGLIQYAPNNLLPYSEQFDNAAWTKVATCTVTSNTTAAPDGSSTADTLNFPAVNDGIYITGSVTSGATYTASVWLWATSAGTIRLKSPGAGLAPTLVNVTTTPTRFSITYTATGASEGLYILRDAAGQLTNVYAWGAQLELGSTATTYNSTTVKNLLGYSESFDNAAWTKTRASMVTGAAANPLNGLFTAQKLMEDTTATNSHYARETVTVPANQLTFSCYVKAAGRSAVRLVNASYGQAAYFGLTGSGVIGTLDTATASIADVGNGWYRCSMTFTQTVAGSVSFDVRAANGTTGGSDNYTGDGNSGIYIFGAQLSDSASLDPYVPTPGAAPTSAAYYGPRFDYDPVTLAAKGLLIEEQRTNLLLQSEAFSSPWTATRASAVSAAVQAPSGASSVIAFTEDATNTSSHELYQNVAKAASAITYTYSLYVKKAGRNWVCVTLWDNSANGNRFWFNVNTGVKGTTTTFGTPFTSATYDLAPAPAGYYRVFVTLTSNTAVNLAVTLYSTDADGSIAPAVALNAAGLYVYGAQLEAGAFATSYIPTVASTVTRSADVATITGSLFSGWYNGSAGTFVVSSLIGAKSPSSYGVYSFDDGTTNNAFPSFYTAATQANSRVGGSNVFTSTSAAISATPGVFKQAFAYANADYSSSFNGAAPTTQASGAIPSGVIRAQLGTYNGQYLNGHIQSITYLPVRNADYQLQGFTA